jgi:hypothetical protein
MKHIILFETYNSNKELTILGKQILHIINSKTMDMKNHIKELAFIDFSDLNINGYVEIYNFLKDNPKLQIIIDKNYMIEIGNGDSKGCYITNDIDKVIALNLTYNTIEQFNKEDTNIKNLDYYMENTYLSTLLHELVHAYDDYRSNGKFSETIKSKDDIAESPLKYQNSKHEIDARFNQAILKTTFKEWIDVDEDGFIYELLPFEKCLKSFRSNFFNYRILPIEEKKRMDAMFGRYYIKIKEDFNPNDQS